MTRLVRRVRGWLRSRTGRLVVHDLALAVAAAAAVVEGAHSVDGGVAKAAGIVALKVLLRVAFPVPPATDESPPDDAGGISDDTTLPGGP